MVEGLDEASAVPGAWVLHAGTALDDDERVVTAGGRVLSVVGTGPSLDAARETAYAAADRIRIRGAHRRSDIALTSSRPRHDLCSQNCDHPGRITTFSGQRSRFREGDGRAVGGVRPVGDLGDQAAEHAQVERSARR